jgi:ATP-dependent Clp protease ATP-binding subunit ClpB
MTSNLGSEHILNNNNQDKIALELRKAFKPEFLNRIDEVIIFNALDKKVVGKIVDKLIHELESKLTEYDLHIKLSDKAKEYIIDTAYDINYGVRPLKRFISRNIETLLAKEIITGNIIHGETINVEFSNNNLVLK